MVTTATMGSLPVVRCASRGPAPGLAPPRGRPRDGPGAWCVVDAGRAVARPVGDAIGPLRRPARRRGRRARKPLAPAQVLEEADPLPHALVEQGLLEGLAAGREPGEGQGELPGRRGLPGRSLWALVPIERHDHLVHPRRPAAGHGHDEVAAGGDRHGVDRARARGASRQLGDQVGGLAQLRDRRRRRRRAPGGSRRRAASSTSPPVAVLDQAWTAVARSAPPCGDPSVATMPRRSSQALAVAALELDQGQPGDDPALRVGDQVDRHARGARRRPPRPGRRAGCPWRGGRPGSRRRRSRRPGSTGSRRSGRAPGRRRS